MDVFNFRRRVRKRMAQTETLTVTTPSFTMVFLERMIMPATRFDGFGFIFSPFSRILFVLTPLTALYR